jgi:hypothetical protein
MESVIKGHTVFDCHKPSRYKKSGNLLIRRRNRINRRTSKLFAAHLEYLDYVGDAWLDGFLSAIGVKVGTPRVSIIFGTLVLLCFEGLGFASAIDNHGIGNGITWNGFLFTFHGSYDNLLFADGFYRHLP